MIFLIIWALALIGAIIHVSVRGLWRQASQRDTIFLLYQLSLSFGLTGALGFLGHALRPVETAMRIGWEPSPQFQFELGSFELGLALAALLGLLIRNCYSELVALDVADIEETTEVLRVTVRRSKTDQEGQGRTLAIPRGDVACPVKALRAWLDAAGIQSGLLFRPIEKGGNVKASRLSDRSVANIVKEYSGRAGFDASNYSGHSLRSGFLTSAAGNGASIFKMMDVSGHALLKPCGAMFVMPSCSRITRGKVCSNVPWGLVSLPVRSSQKYLKF